MYKLLLCFRYLQTRYLAFICIVSVMLGVATLIVVNAVMSGFSTKLKDRLHGVLSDVIIDTERTDGFDVVRESKRELTPEEIEKYRADTRLARPGPQMTVHPLGAGSGAKEGGVPGVLEVNRYQTPEAYRGRNGFNKTLTTYRYLTPAGIMKEIKDSPAGNKIEAITPTIETFAILQFNYRGTVIAKPIRLIGIDPDGRAIVGGFSNFLSVKKTPRTPALISRLRRWNDTNSEARQIKLEEANQVPPQLPKMNPDGIPEPKMDEHIRMPQPKLNGVILGYALALPLPGRQRKHRGGARAAVEGDNVIITTAGGQELKPVWGSFIVTDYLKTEMSEIRPELRLRATGAAATHSRHIGTCHRGSRLN